METQTENEPENEHPEDVRPLRVMMMDILNEEIKKYNTENSKRSL
jgi:hypothetical protein